MSKRQYKWNEKTQELEQIGGPPEFGWEIKPFRCGVCVQEFITVVPIKCRTATSPCCGTKSYRVFKAPQLLEKRKWMNTGKNNPDGGIPFGQVPGDSDYKDIDNPLGPKP